MPPSAAAAAVTNGYRRRLLDLRDATALAVAALLEDVDLDVGPAAVTRALAAWRDRSRALVLAAEEQAAGVSLTYLSAYLLASGAAPVSVRVEPEVPDPEGLSVVRGALLWRLGQGTGRGMAMRTATATARRASREAIGRAATGTLNTAITREPQVDGWHRVTSARCCSRCASRAGRRFADRDDFDPSHPACRCTPEPTVIGRAETVRRQSPTVVAP